MFCLKCGKPLSEGDLFCQSCGTKAWSKPENTVPVKANEEKPVILEPEVTPVVEETAVEEVPVEPEIVGAATFEFETEMEPPTMTPFESVIEEAPKEPEFVPVEEKTPVEPEPEIAPIIEETSVAPVATETREDAFCTNCGAKLPEGSLFCLRCGEKVDAFEEGSSIAEVNMADVNPEPQPANFSYPENVNPDGDIESMGSNENEKTKQKEPKSGSKGKKKPIIIVAIVVALALIAGAIFFFVEFMYPCDFCGRRVYTPRMFWIEKTDGGYWVCGDCYYRDPSNQEALQDGEAIGDDTGAVVPDGDGNTQDADTAPEDTPVTPEPENAPPVPEEYTYSGETFTFNSTIYMGEFAEDHDDEMDFRFYEWKGDQVEVEVEVYAVPEGYDAADYMTTLEDFYGDDVYTDSWLHSMAMVPEAYNMSECWESNGIDVIMNTDNYLYVFQIFTDNMEYQNDLYNSISNVEINE